MRGKDTTFWRKSQGNNEPMSILPFTSLSFFVLYLIGFFCTLPNQRSAFCSLTNQLTTHISPLWYSAKKISEALL